MSKKEIIQNNSLNKTTQTTESTHNDLGEVEKLPKSPRIEVYGSRLSGAFELTDELTAYLKEQGLPDANVGVTRFASNIETTFFGRQPSTANMPELSDGESDKPQRKFLRGLGGSLVKRSTRLGNVNQGATIPADTIPDGVIILPEMRQHNILMPGHNMTIPTPIESIQKLCEQYNVPFVLIEKLDTPQQIQEGVKQLLSGDPQDQLG